MIYFTTEETSDRYRGLPCGPCWKRRRVTKWEPIPEVPGEGYARSGEPPTRWEDV